MRYQYRLPVFVFTLEVEENSVKATIVKKGVFSSFTSPKMLPEPLVLSAVVSDPKNFTLTESDRVYAFNYIEGKGYQVTVTFKGNPEASYILSPVNE